MRCVRCGCQESLHVRADGHCLGCTCEAFLAKWPDAAPETALETPKAKAKAPKADAEKDK